MQLLEGFGNNMHTNTSLHTYIQKTTAAVVKQYNEHVEPVNQSSLSICQKHHGINYASFIKVLCTRSSSLVVLLHRYLTNFLCCTVYMPNCLDNYRYIGICIYLVPFSLSICQNLSLHLSKTSRY